MAGRNFTARPPSGLGLRVLTNVTRTLSHLCIDAVNGSGQLALLKISQTGRPGPVHGPIVAQGRDK